MKNLGQIEIKKVSNIRDTNGVFQFDDVNWIYNALFLFENAVSKSLNKSKDTICDKDEETKMPKDDFDKLNLGLSPFSHLDLGIESWIENEGRLSKLSVTKN